jgi:hypothetical protein
MCIAAVFSFTLAGCDDPNSNSGGGGDENKMTLTIKNMTSGANAKDITGFAYYDRSHERWILGSGANSFRPDTWDESKTVPAGETKTFTIEPAGGTVTMFVRTDDDYYSVHIGGGVKTLGFKHSGVDDIYELLHLE